VGAATNGPHQNGFVVTGAEPSHDGSFHPCGAIIEYRYAGQSRMPLASLEFVDGVPSLLAEQRSELDLVLPQ
jgi:hypothetical protein